MCFLTVLILLILSAAPELRAQKTAKSGSDKINIIRSRSIDSLVNRHKSLNEQKKTVPGYRIQIYFGSQRTKANETKASFMQKYPDYNAYIIYQQPNFKIRVGDFRTRLEAYRLYKELQAEYESAFIIRDEIRLDLPD
jgi:hypothetical protein